MLVEHTMTVNFSYKVISGLLVKKCSFNDKSMTFCMLGEHTMTVNFSYKDISNLILDLNSGHFSKWPPEYTCTCLNISVSKSHRKMILVSKYPFLGPSIPKKGNYKYANLTWLVTIFQNGRLNISVSNSHRKKSWCLNIYFLDQGLQKRQL